MTNQDIFAAIDVELARASTIDPRTAPHDRARDYAAETLRYDPSTACADRDALYVEGLRAELRRLPDAPERDFVLAFFARFGVSA